MRSFYYLALSLLFLTAALVSFGQNLKEIPPPTAPFVASIPENADWSIETKLKPLPAPVPDQPEIPGKTDRRIASIHTIKTGKTQYEQTTYGDNSTMERWYVGSYCLYAPPRQEVSVMDMSSVTDENGQPMSMSNGFRGLEWIKKESYDKVELMERTPCYHYVLNEREAWINVQTRFPVAHKDAAGQLYIYRFNAPPEKNLTLPGAYAKAWEQLQQLLNARR